MEILQQITETENRINFLAGSFPKKLNRNKAMFVSTSPSQIQVGVPSDLLKNRPDIRQAEYELAASKANLKAARAAFYPSFNITGSLGFQAFNTSYLFTNPESGAYRLFGSLVAPLINRSAIKAEFNSAKANQQEAMYAYQKSIINGYVEVYNDIARMKNLEQMYDFKSREVNVLTKSIGTSSQLFQTGRANYLELLLTQRNALQSRLELVNVKKRQFNSVIDLYKALGGGWK
jgi:outer membrane protein TolC